MCAALERKTLQQNEQNNEPGDSVVDEKENEEMNDAPSIEETQEKETSNTENKGAEDDTTEETTTEPPATEPPTTEPPTTEPPATEPPETEPSDSNNDSWGGGESGL